MAVVDVVTGQTLANQTVLIVGNRIRALGPAGAVRVPARAHRIDARRQYLIPGLWDMHLHATKSMPLFDSVAAVLPRDFAYPILLTYGITGIRDPGSPVPLATLVQWKRDIAAGTRIGPRLVIASPKLNEGPRRAEGDAIYLSTPAEARQVVDSLQVHGADMLKTYFLSPMLYFAIAAEARRVGILFGGHAELGGLEASDSGARILDHQTWVGADPCGEYSADSLHAAQCAAVGQRLRHNGTWVEQDGSYIDLFPSLAVRRLARYMPDSLARRWQAQEGLSAGGPAPMSTADWAAVVGHADTPRLTALSQRREVIRYLPILAGTDGGMFALGAMPGVALHDVLVSFVLRGMTPLDALRTATLNPARALDATDSLGAVAPGKLADLVLLGADPLADIWNTTKIRAVVANGRYYDRAVLDHLRVEAERAARSACDSHLHLQP